MTTNQSGKHYTKEEADKIASDLLVYNAVVERVARGIEETGILATTTELFDMAKAAIEALDIIILPADAEPIKGDVLWGEKEMLFYKIANDLAGTSLDIEVAQAKRFMARGCEIILRNGKRVIQGTTEGA